MEKILERDRRNELYKLRDEIFEPPYKIKKGWYIKEDWVAVPFETLGEFIIEKTELLSQKLKKYGLNEFLAIEAEGFVSDDFGVYKINNTIEDYKKIWGYSGLFFVIIPPNVDFILLNSADDFSVLAGPRHFVEDIFDNSIESIRKEFIEYITYLCSDNPKYFEFQNNVAKYYEEFNT